MQELNAIEVCDETKKRQIEKQVKLEPVRTTQQPQMSSNIQNKNISNINDKNSF